jgi:hypothetical protein
MVEVPVKILSIFRTQVLSGTPGSQSSYSVCGYTLVKPVIGPKDCSLVHDLCGNAVSTVANSGHSVPLPLTFKSSTFCSVWFSQ